MTRFAMYDLAGADPALRFSPYCWRIRLAVAHKGLEVETLPWRFTEKDVLAPSGQGRVPVLVDRETGRWVADSWAIAGYLDEVSPDRPLFGAPGLRDALRFLNAWSDTVLVPAIAPLVVRDILDVIAERDLAYFRQSREARFGRTLEEVQANREERLPAFRSGTLAPLRAVLANQPWLAGDAPGYADYIVFGCFQWARCISTFELLAPDDPVAGWRERMLDLFGGLARKAPRVG